MTSSSSRTVAVPCLSAELTHPMPNTVRAHSESALPTTWPWASHWPLQGWIRTDPQATVLTNNSNSYTVRRWNIYSLCKLFTEVYLNQIKTTNNVSTYSSSINFHPVTTVSAQVIEQSSPEGTPVCPPLSQDSHYSLTSNIIPYFCYFCHLYKWNYTKCALLHLASLTQKYVCEIHPCYYM